MMKSFFPEILWSKITKVGFDIDGTLYDEYDFISQVYEPIANELSRVKTETPEEIYSSIISKWKEKGSAYNKIFEEALIDSEIQSDQRQEVIGNCLSIFREFKPNIKLTGYVESLLSEVHQNFEIFIVTDGNAQLQKSKFDSLKLNRWFKEENLGICGSHEESFAKPATKILGTLEAFASGVFDPNVVYFGDREVDLRFASNAGFEFIQVKCMNPVVGTIRHD